MTEDEAKAKWCPFARVQVAPYVAANRETDQSPDNYSTCIASACMAWRWKYEQTNKSPTGMASWPMVEPIYRQTESGYCGLAGGSQ